RDRRGWCLHSSTQAPGKPTHRNEFACPGSSGGRSDAHRSTLPSARDLLPRSAPVPMSGSQRFAVHSPPPLVLLRGKPPQRRINLLTCKPRRPFVPLRVLRGFKSLLSAFIGVHLRLPCVH